MVLAVSGAHKWLNGQSRCAARQVINWKGAYRYNTKETRRSYYQLRLE